jgi:hypothetical protein
MTTFDFKKDRKDLYQPPTAPGIADVPAMLFLMADGTGDPNTSEAYASAIQSLMGLSYAIRMNKTEAGYFEYVVPPLEGLWDFADPSALTGGAGFKKSDFVWTMLVRQPEFVTPDVLERAKAKLQKKKPGLDLQKVRLERVAEGLCVQALHLGPYDAEPATVKAMERYQEQRGFKLDFSKTRKHHEIYLTDPRKCAPETMKTVLRLPVKKR